jgi:hypothetical protein
VKAAVSNKQRPSLSLAPLLENSSALSFCALGRSTLKPLGSDTKHNVKDESDTYLAHDPDLDALPRPLDLALD